MDKRYSTQAPDFAPPGRKLLPKSNIEYEGVLIDGIGIPTEHPKKTKEFLFRKKEKQKPPLALQDKKKIQEPASERFCNQNVIEKTKIDKSRNIVNKFIIRPDLILSIYNVEVSK